MPGSAPDARTGRGGRSEGRDGSAVALPRPVGSPGRRVGGDHPGRQADEPGRTGVGHKMAPSADVTRTVRAAIRWQTRRSSSRAWHRAGPLAVGAEPGVRRKPPAARGRAISVLRDAGRERSGARSLPPTARRDRRTPGRGRRLQAKRRDAPTRSRKSIGQRRVSWRRASARPAERDRDAIVGVPAGRPEGPDGAFVAGAPPWHPGGPRTGDRRRSDGPAGARAGRGAMGSRSERRRSSRVGAPCPARACRSSRLVRSSKMDGTDRNGRAGATRCVGEHGSRTRFATASPVGSHTGARRRRPKRSRGRRRQRPRDVAMRGAARGEPRGWRRPRAHRAAGRAARAGFAAPTVTQGSGRARWQGSAIPSTPCRSAAGRTPGIRVAGRARRCSRLGGGRAEGAGRSRPGGGGPRARCRASASDPVGAGGWSESGRAGSWERPGCPRGCAGSVRAAAR